MDVAGTKRSSLVLAWAGWAILFFITSVMIMKASGRTVVPAYREGALNWMSGQNLYDGLGVGGFVYFPQSAILFVPFALLPVVAGEVLWRLVNIGLYAAGLFFFSRLPADRSGNELFPLMTLVSLPVVWDCARNGQATLAMTGLMLLAVVDVARDRWWRATLWLCLGVAVKPLAIVFVLLIMATHRPMTWRVMAGMILLALSPFATQYPSYVVHQYATCLHNMATAAHVGVAAHGWTTPFTALREAGLDVPERIQTVIRLLAAMATLVLCHITMRRHGSSRAAVYLFALAALYVMLFSPRTENNTYAMLGPAIGLFLSSAFLIESRSGEGILLVGMVAVLVGSRAIERLFAPHAEQVWLSPIIATCFTAYLLWRFVTEPAAAGAGSAATG